METFPPQPDSPDRTSGAEGQRPSGTAAGAPAFTPKERRLLLRHYAYPSYGWAGFVCSMLVLLVWFLYECIEGIFIDVETARGPIDVVFYLMIAFCCLGVAGFCYWLLYPKFTRMGKTFRGIGEKVAAEPDANIDPRRVGAILATGAAGRLIRGDGQSDVRDAVGGAMEVAAAAGTAAASYEMARGMKDAAQRMLQRCGIPVPKVALKCRLIAFGPAVLMAVVAIVLMVGDVHFRDAKEAEINGYMEQLAQDYGYCDSVRWDDPGGRGISSRDTYKFWAELRADGGAYDPMLVLDVDWDGTVQAVTFMCYLDPDGFQASVAASEGDFGRLAATLGEGDVPLATDALAGAGAYSDGFREALEQGGVYEPASESYETSTGLSVAEYYETEGEADFDEFTRPYIWVKVEQS